MKVNLHNGKSELDGYTNINILKHSNFDDQVDNAEAIEILADGILNLVFPNDLSNTLSYWISKLRHGGKITFVFIDLYEISRAYFQHKLNINDATNLLYGNNNQNCISLLELSNFLKQAGLKIIKKRTANYKSVIVAKRP